MNALEIIERLNTELLLSKETHNADKKLWIIEKLHYNIDSTVNVNFILIFIDFKNIKQFYSLKRLQYVKKLSL